MNLNALTMADNEQKAMQLIAEAEKKLTSSKGFLGSLFGFVFSTFLFVDSSNCTAKSGKLQLFFLSSPLLVSSSVRICFHFSLLKQWLQQS